MNYILVSESGQAVPLPFEVQDDDGSPIVIYNFSDPQADSPLLVGGLLHTSTGLQLPSALGLHIITEAEYMESQTCAK